MFRSIIDRFLANAAAPLGAALAVGLFFAAPVQAAPSTITLTMPCDGYTLSGTAPNQTLTCVVLTAPSGCSIQGPTTGTINSSIALTAACSGGGAATQWTWTGGHCQGVATQSCTGTETQAGPVTYNVVAGNQEGNAAMASSTVTWSAQSGPPSG